MTKVFVVCSGLGHIHRGYEAFAGDLHRSLCESSELDVWLFKGAGRNGPQQIVLPTLRRDGVVARFVGALLRRGSYVVEQASFTLSLLPHLLRQQPTVIYYPDPTVGKLLWHWRALTGAGYRLLFQNGGPHAPPHRWCDHVQQLTPTAAAQAVAAGHSPAEQTLLPYAVLCDGPPAHLNGAQRAALRQELGLPASGQVVLSVGALNVGHKRMDYLIREVGAITTSRPFLVMLGQEEGDTPALRELAASVLGTGGFQMRTVTREEVGKYYLAADAFVLASLVEGFGLVLAEALAHGLACIAHDTPVTRFVLEAEGILGDLGREGALTELLNQTLAREPTIAERLRRYRSVESRFAWKSLLPKYVAMLSQVAGSGGPHLVECASPSSVRLDGAGQTA